jgi:hypothetical protein
MYRCSFLTPGLRDVYDEQLRLMASEQRFKVEKKEERQNSWGGGADSEGATFSYGDIEIPVVPYVRNSLFKLWDLQRALPAPCIPCLKKGSIDDRKKANFFLDVERTLEQDVPLRESLSRLYRVVLRKNDLDSNVSRADFSRFHHDMVAALAVGTGWRAMKPTITTKSWPVWRDPEGKPVHSKELTDAHYQIPNGLVEEAMEMKWEKMHHAMPDNEFNFETFAKFVMSLCECWMADSSRVPTTGQKPEYLEYCMELHGRLINTMYKRHVMEPFNMELFLQLDLNTTGRIDLPNLKEVAKMLVDAGHLEEVPSFDELSLMIEAVSDDPDRIGGCGYMFFEHMMKNKVRNIGTAWDTWRQHTNTYVEKQRQELLLENYSDEQRQRMEDLERARQAVGGNAKKHKEEMSEMVLQGTTANLDRRASTEVAKPSVVIVHNTAPVPVPAPAPATDSSFAPMPIDIAPVGAEPPALMARVQTPEFMPRSPPGRPFELARASPSQVSAGSIDRADVDGSMHASYVSNASRSSLPSPHSFLPSLKVVVKTGEVPSRGNSAARDFNSSVVEPSVEHSGEMEEPEMAFGSDLKLGEMEHYTLGLGSTGMPSVRTPEAESASFFTTMPKAVVPKPLPKGHKPNHSSKFNSHLGSGGGSIYRAGSRDSINNGAGANVHDQRRVVSARPYNSSASWNATVNMHVTAPVLDDGSGDGGIEKSISLSGGMGSAERARVEARAQLSAPRARAPSLQQQQQEQVGDNYQHSKAVVSYSSTIDARARSKRRSASAQPRRNPNFKASKAIAAAEKVASATWGKNKQNPTGLLASASLPGVIPKPDSMGHLSAERRAKIDKIKASLTMRSLAGI